MPVRTPSDAVPDIGATLDELETPALIVDLDVMEANIDRYTEIARRHDVRLRSHVKTHKVPAIAHHQVATTGGGIVCQKLSEVEVMAAAGLTDIYLSYQVVGDPKLRRLTKLVDGPASIATTVDGPGNIAPLQAMAAAEDVMVPTVLEIDVGVGRTGVQPGEPAVELARRLRSETHLRFAGIMAYEAHVKSIADSEAAYERDCHEVMEVVADTVDMMKDDDIEVPEVKVGGTATSPYSARHPVVDEINPGQYAFNDVGEMEARPWAVDTDDCALTVLSTVISTQVDGQIVVDAGSKSLSMDTARMPVAVDRDDLRYAGYSEEHGHIDTSESDQSFSVGDRLSFIAPHVCPTINLHDTLVGVRDGVVTNVWDIQARGKVK